jgi:hypothetical protein
MVNKKILGMPIAMLVIGLLVVAGASAALLTYYVNVVGTANIDQSVVWWDGTTASTDTKVYAFASSAVAGNSYTESFMIKNLGTGPATVQLVTNCSAATTDCVGIDWVHRTIPYSYNQAIDIVNDFDLLVKIEDDGEWLKWTFDYPTETWVGNGQLPLGLIIATNGVLPSFQIHNNDGSDAAHPFGTWLYSPYDADLDSGCNWMGWHSGCVNTVLSDPSMDWVEATGNYYGEGTDGVLVIRMKKTALGDNFHWAAVAQTGGGWNDPYKNKQMPTPASFSWATPTVGASNYHAASIPEFDVITGPFVLEGGEVFSFDTTFDFHVLLKSDSFELETRVEPAVMP